MVVVQWRRLPHADRRQPGRGRGQWRTVRVVAGGSDDRVCPRRATQRGIHGTQEDGGLVWDALRSRDGGTRSAVTTDASRTSAIGAVQVNRSTARRRGASMSSCSSRTVTQVQHPFVVADRRAGAEIARGRRSRAVVVDRCAGLSFIMREWSCRICGNTSPGRRAELQTGCCAVLRVAARLTNATATLERHAGTTLVVRRSRLFPDAGRGAACGGGVPPARGLPEELESWQPLSPSGPHLMRTREEQPQRRMPLF